MQGNAFDGAWVILALFVAHLLWHDLSVRLAISGAHLSQCYDNLAEMKADPIYNHDLRPN